MWAWIVGLAKGALSGAAQSFIVAQLANLADWAISLGAKWWHSLKMKKIKKAVDEKDNIDIEKSIGNPSAGDPSGFDGVQRRPKGKNKS